jgi:hypothetical protein
MESMATVATAATVLRRRRIVSVSRIEQLTLIAFGFETGSKKAANPASDGPITAMAY